ncbi:MAG: hypothetical protein ACE37H_01325 [Phycisphaeraceae bacterium]
MKVLLAILVSASFGAVAITPTLADPPADDARPDAVAPDAGLTFAYIDVTIDPRGKPLGAYQFVLSAPGVNFTVVGVEAGEHPAFDHDRPPYFDRLAQEIDIDRLIVAEYALPHLDAEQLPTEPVRVARVHVMFMQPVDAEALPELELKLMTAGDADGRKIDAKPSHTLSIPERPE